MKSRFSAPHIAASYLSIYIASTSCFSEPSDNVATIVIIVNN